jgi:hypothetical protein
LIETGRKKDPQFAITTVQPKILASVPLKFFNAKHSLFQVSYVTKESICESIQPEGLKNVPSLNLIGSITQEIQQNESEHPMPTNCL